MFACLVPTVHRFSIGWLVRLNSHARYQRDAVVSCFLACLASFSNYEHYNATPQQAEQKSVAVLDKRICEALTYADEVMDVKKDEAIEGAVSVKKAINTLGPVQTVVVS